MKENETVKDWLNRISIKNNSFLEKLKKQKKYDLFYSFIFKLKVKILVLKKIINKY